MKPPHETAQIVKDPKPAPRHRVNDIGEKAEVRIIVLPVDILGTDQRQVALAKPRVVVVEVEHHTAVKPEHLVEKRPIRSPIV